MKFAAILTMRRVIVALFLLAMGLISVFQLLLLSHLPETPANDLAKHVASILNFRDAFQDGQLLPRLQLLPAKLPDIPFFQFYGTLTGYLSLPFLLLKFPPLISLVLSIFLIRCVGLFAIYESGKLVGSDTKGSLLAATTYLLTPYILSNLYGRVAFPEATAHGVLPLLFYGVLRLFYKSDTLSVLIIGSSVVALSMAHPIFLLYGCLFSGIFGLFLYRDKCFILLCIALLGALLIASFQWLPGFIYRGNFEMGFTENSPFYQRQWTSLSGLFGMPKSLDAEGLLIGSDRLYLTPGILTIPVMLLLLRRKETVARALFVSGCVALFFSYSFLDVWKYLPSPFWALQFPYRLLSFLSLFVAIGVAIVFKEIKYWLWFFIMAVVIFQSYPILTQVTYSSPLTSSESEESIKEIYASQDYVWKKKSPSIIGPDGWLMDYVFPLWQRDIPAIDMVDKNGLLPEKNIINAGSTNFPDNFVRLVGSISDADSQQGYNIWIEYRDSAGQPLDGFRYTKGGAFSAQFRIPNNGKSLTFRCAVAPLKFGAIVDSQICPSIHVQAIDRLPGNGIYIAEKLTDHQVITIEGRSIFPDKDVDFWFARPSNPEQPATERVTVKPGRFNTYLTLPTEPGLYMLVTSRYLIPADEGDGSQDRRRLSLFIDQLSETPMDGMRSLEAIKSAQHGYVRNFLVKTPVVGKAVTSNEYFNVILPMAFSPLIEVSQGGVLHDTYYSNRGLIRIKTNDAMTPIIARYKFSALVKSFMMLGLIIMIFLVLFLRRHAVSPNLPRYRSE